MSIEELEYAKSRMEEANEWIAKIKKESNAKTCGERSKESMITLEEAKAIADTRLADITECTEMTNAYVFVNPRTKYAIGGPDSSAIVMKEDGRLVPPVEYYMQIGCGEEVRTIKYIDDIDPTDYFTPEMLKVVEEWEKKLILQMLKTRNITDFSTGASGNSCQSLHTSMDNKENICLKERE